MKKTTIPYALLIFSGILLGTGSLQPLNAQSTVKAMLTPPIVDKDKQASTSFHEYPAELLAFNINEQTGANNITWQTGYEEGLIKFVIEYSEDNIHYYKAGEVPAKNITAGARYNFRHVVNNPDRKVYYRLAAVNQNGRVALSPNQSRLLTGASGNAVFPTVINNHVVNMYLNEPFETAEIVNMSGKIIRKQMIGNRTGRIDIVVPTTLTGAAVVKLHHKDPSKSIVKKVLFN